MTKEGYVYNPSCEFSSRNDSSCVPHMLQNFKEFWPNEVDHFKDLVGSYPFVDLACGTVDNCGDALRILTQFMGRSPINSYIGVDRFNINDDSQNNLINELLTAEVSPPDKITLKPTLVLLSEIQPNLSQNITLHSSDMVEYLKTLPNESVKILSIGGFAQCICDLRHPYRRLLVPEIQRVLAPDSYFLNAASELNIRSDFSDHKIIRVEKSKEVAWLNESSFNQRFWKYFELYKRL